MSKNLLCDTCGAVMVPGKASWELGKTNGYVKIPGRVRRKQGVKAWEVKSKLKDHKYQWEPGPTIDVCDACWRAFASTMRKIREGQV